MFALGKILVLSIAAISSAFAGELPRSLVLRDPGKGASYTGDLRTDLFARRDPVLSPGLPQEEGVLTADEHHKSPWLAAGLSAVLPGAGEFYAENYWKAAAFLALDVTLIALAYSFDNKADKQDAVNARYADEHWSAERYARAALGLRYVPSSDSATYARTIFTGNPNLPSWERVNWEELNRLERQIGSTAEGRSFSHTLPRRPEQQYFELIGKYGQFTLGWDDHSGEYNPSEPAAMGRFKFYATERARTEDFYSTASTLVTVTVVNHLLSAADAAWTASTFNKRLHTSMRMQRVPTEFGFANVPVARLEYSF